MDTYIARQPIMDRDQRLAAYELLYHQDSTTLYNQRDARVANAIIQFFNDLDSQKFLDGKDAFLTFTPNLLMQNVPRVFDEHKLVIQIEDNVLVHPVARMIIQRYKKQGYRLALIGFSFNNRYLEILPLIDILKVDFTDPQDTNIATAVELARKFKKKIAAVNVNTPEAREKAIALSCDYFQGKSIADMVRSKVHRVDYLHSNFFRLMVAVTRDEPDLDEIARLVSMDVTLTFSLIKMVNSAYFALAHRVKDVKQALTILGLGQLRQWIYLLSFSPDGGMSDEMIKSSFLRATFCDELSQCAAGFPVARSEVYLMGMFSVLDALLDVPMEDALKELPISDEVKEALLHRTGPCGELLSLCLSYESGDWGEVNRTAAALNISLDVIAQKYLEAVEYVTQIWNELMSPFFPDEESGAGRPAGKKADKADQEPAADKAGKPAKADKRGAKQPK